MVLETAALCQPGLPIGIKFGNAKRLVIDVGLLAADGTMSVHMVRRFGQGDDWVRESEWQRRAELLVQLAPPAA